MNTDKKDKDDYFRFLSSHPRSSVFICGCFFIQSRHFTTAPKNAPVEYVRIPAVTPKPLLVLASNSPRRRELLALGGWMFHVRPAEVDESQRPGEAPNGYVLRLAEEKARACACTAHEDLTILAADTAVVDGVSILGKPRDMAEAVVMLRQLRGRTHQVYTGIAVLRMSDRALLTDLCITDVPMRNYSDEEITAYVATGDPLDKAGAYAIQHPKFRPVESLSGCFASVMGLPLCHLTRILLQLEIEPKTEVPEECQSNLKYNCPIFSAVLDGQDIG
jgi:septum formation protein